MAGIAELMQVAQTLGAYKKIPQDTAIPDAASSALSGIAKGAGWNETADDKLARAVKLMQAVEIMQKIKQQKLDSAIALEGAKQVGIVGMGSLGEPTTPQDNNAIRNALSAYVSRERIKLDKPLQQKTEAGIAEMAVKKGTGNAGRKFKTTYGADGKWATAEEPEFITVTPRRLDTATNKETDADYQVEIKRGEDIPVITWDSSKMVKAENAGAKQFSSEEKTYVEFLEKEIDNIKQKIDQEYKQAGNKENAAVAVLKKQYDDRTKELNDFLTKKGLTHENVYGTVETKKKMGGLAGLLGRKKTVSTAIDMSKLNQKEKDLYDWAKANPNEQDAINIMETLKGKYGQ